MTHFFHDSSEVIVFFLINCYSSPGDSSYENAYPECLRLKLIFSPLLLSGDEGDELIDFCESLIDFDDYPLDSSDLFNYSLKF